MPRRQDEDVGTPSLLSIAMAPRTSAIYAAQKIVEHILAADEHRDFRTSNRIRCLCRNASPRPLVRQLAAIYPLCGGSLIKRTNKSRPRLLRLLDIVSSTRTHGDMSDMSVPQRCQRTVGLDLQLHTATVRLPCSRAPPAPTSPACPGALAQCLLIVALFSPHSALFACTL